MDMSSLFPSDSVTGGTPSDPSVHVSFRAGVLNRDASTNQMTADPRPGTFQILTSLEDGLVHIQWKPRGAVEAEQDLILINGETEMKQVMSCPASARVYVLKWRDSDTRLFLWMQEKDTSQDATKVSIVNGILENGPTPHQRMQNEPESLAEHQPLTSASPSPYTPTSATGSGGPSVPAPAAESTSASTPSPAVNAVVPALLDTETPAARTPITLEQVRAALTPQREQAGDLARQREILHTTPTPMDLLNMDDLKPILEDARVQQGLGKVMELAPPDDRGAEHIDAVLRSPALRAQAATLSAALNTEQAGELLRSFGFHEEAPGGSSSSSPFGVRAFLDALLRIQREGQHREDGEDSPSHDEH